MQNITQKQLYNISLKACENMKDARVGKQSVRFCANVEHMVMTEKPWQPTPKGANFSQQRIEQPSVAVSCYFCQKTKRKLFFCQKAERNFCFLQNRYIFSKSKLNHTDHMGALKNLGYQHFRSTRMLISWKNIATSWAQYYFLSYVMS